MNRRRRLDMARPPRPTLIRMADRAGHTPYLRLRTYPAAGIGAANAIREDPRVDEDARAAGTGRSRQPIPAPASVAVVPRDDSRRTPFRTLLSKAQSGLRARGRDRRRTATVIPILQARLELHAMLQDDGALRHADVRSLGLSDDEQGRTSPPSRRCPPRADPCWFPWRRRTPPRPRRRSSRRRTRRPWTSSQSWTGPRGSRQPLAARC
jgi:hypothetical protein